MEDSFQNFVSFLASSSNGVKTDEWWRCANVYHEEWFLPCYNDTAWPEVFLIPYKAKQFHFIARDAKWITYDYKSKKIYCRRKVKKGKIMSLKLCPNEGLEKSRSIGQKLQ